MVEILFGWLPFLKIVPVLYGYRISLLLKKHYDALYRMEQSLEQAEDAAELRRRLSALDSLRLAMRTISQKVPGYLQGDIYNWRLHIGLVRTEALERLARLEEIGTRS